MKSEPENSIEPSSREEWREWLMENHERAEGVWLITFKKSSGRMILDYEDIVEEAVCFGWIDSKVAALNAQRTMIYVAPRKRGGGWSRSNKERIERILAKGIMHPSGMAKIEAAKASGAWTLLDEVENLAVPEDLAQALDTYKGRENWDEFSDSAKKEILTWIVMAKKPETRSKRIEETAAKAAQGERANYRPEQG